MTVRRLANKLNIDYKTVIHHLTQLLNNYFDPCIDFGITATMETFKPTLKWWMHKC